MPENTFLSYSRHEYYFAESVTLNLQHRGLSVWFDLQQIEPGTNWKADIDDGLARSLSLTLVASRASLASPYVEREWRAALDANKPIYVTLFEPVRLPRDLRRRAIVLDFRADFERGVDDLATLLEGGTVPGHRVISWLPRLPVGVRRMALALAVLDAQILAANVLTLVLLAMTLYPGSIVRLLAEYFLSREFDIPLWADLLIAGATIFVVIRYTLDFRDRAQVVFFLWRDFDYAALAKGLRSRVGAMFMIYLLVILGVSDYLWATPQVLRRLGIAQSLPVAYDPAVLVALLLAVGAIRVIMPRLVRRFVPRHPDPDIVRWALLGRVPQQMRITVNRNLLPPTSADLPSNEAVLQTSATGNAPPVPGTPSLAVPHGDTPATYRIVHAAGDEDAARRIEGIISKMGYAQADDAAYTLLVLSYRTPVDLVRECLHLSANVIGVMVTDIDLPPDVRTLADDQLLDARRNNWPQVEAALRFLASQDEAARARYSQNLLPVSLAPTHDEPGVKRVVNYLMMATGFILLFVFLYFLRMTLASVLIRPLPAIFMSPVVGCVVLLLVSIALLWCVTGALHGRLRLPLRGMWGLMTLAALVMLVVDLTDGLSFDFSANAERVDHQLLLLLIAFYGLSALRVTGLLRPQRHVLVSPRAAVLGMPPVSSSWLVIFVTLCVAALVMALLALMLI